MYKRDKGATGNSRNCFRESNRKKKGQRLNEKVKQTDEARKRKVARPKAEVKSQLPTKQSWLFGKSDLQ